MNTAARTLRLAHRGDWRRAPENTVAALTAALAIPGCDGVEFDVRTSSDGVPVLQHDEILARVHQLADRPSDLTAEQLRAAGVSTLDEALAAAADAFLDIEVKDGPAEAFVDVVEARRGPELHHAVVSSFVPAVIRAVHERRPAWRVWLNAMTLDEWTLDLAVELDCAGVSAEWRSIDVAAMRRARDAGLDVAAWTVRRRSTFDRLARLGVIAVCVEAAALDG